MIRAKRHEPEGICISTMYWDPETGRVGRLYATEKMNCALCDNCYSDPRGGCIFGGPYSGFRYLP